MRKEYDLRSLKKAEPKYMKRLKESVTMRLDPRVTAYFKRLAEETGIPYQSLIGYVLRDYANHGLRPANDWERLEPPGGDPRRDVGRAAGGVGERAEGRRKPTA